jgi:capsular polysaccharide biosynthesis protein
LASRLARQDAQTVFARRTPQPGSGLHQCCLCRADCVVPVCWEEADDEHWCILLRCAECDTYREVVVPDDAAKRYERDLERGIAAIAKALERLDRARMASQVDTFVAALEHDLIDAADFSPR